MRWQVGWRVVRRMAFVASLVAFTCASASPGTIVGWGGWVLGADLSQGFVAVAAGYSHSLGLKSDGSIVAWGANRAGQCVIPAPNSDFVAIAAGGEHSLGVKADGPSFFPVPSARRPLCTPSAARARHPEVPPCGVQA